MNLAEAKVFDGLEVRDGHSRFGQLDPSFAWRFLDPSQFAAALDRRHLTDVRALVLGPGVTQPLSTGSSSPTLAAVRSLWVESAMISVESLAPEVETLVFESLDDASWLDRSLSRWPLRAPSLRSLVIDTWGLTASTLRWLYEAEVPSLEALHLGLGAAEYGADHSLDDLAPLFSGQLFRSLRELGLHFADINRIHGNLLSELSVAPLVRRLRTLDLRACWFEGTQSDLDPAWVRDVDVRWDSEWIGPGEHVRYVPTIE